MSTPHVPEHVAVAMTLGAVLDRVGVAYMVCGSLASSLQGEPRTTYDLDVVVDLRREQLAALQRELEAGFIVDPAALQYAVETGSGCNLLHRDTAFRVDLFVLRSRPFSLEEFARRERRRVTPAGDTWLSVATVEDTVLTKLEWYRKGGEVSDRQWRDVIGMFKLRSGELDGAYLDRWAVELGIADLLDRAREESGTERS